MRNEKERAVEECERKKSEKAEYIQKSRSWGVEYNAFLLEGISLRWQLLSRASSAVLGKADWQRAVWENMLISRQAATG